jgi:cell division protein FtsB
MVVRYRLRAFLIPLALYVTSGLVVSYFVYHAQHGNRGIETKMALKAQIRALEGELGGLQEEHASWDRRVAMLRPASIDRDLLDERSRAMLNRLHKNDVVVMTGAVAASVP